MRPKRRARSSSDFSAVLVCLLNQSFDIYCLMLTGFFGHTELLDFDFSNFFHDAPQRRFIRSAQRRSCHNFSAYVS